jgi:hypothetical protein
MSKDKIIEKPVKKHWYKSAVLPWAIIIIVAWTVTVFIASYFYTCGVMSQHNADVIREASSIVKTLK